ncbi:hypothetical protein SAMN04488061_2229 [Filomicrobium insigne]|uniref:Uncharacterized protein n=1 Tax=Filomicrobium insigne TaxID=418854 RepID=A0A1H0Q4P6_9HYPH|nr:hypothetical protein SAMN04488061_2229 [Filomicrobium insigne]
MNWEQRGLSGDRPLCKIMGWRRPSFPQIKHRYGACNGGSSRLSNLNFAILKRSELRRLGPLCSPPEGMNHTLLRLVLGPLELLRNLRLLDRQHKGVGLDLLNLV